MERKKWSDLVRPGEWFHLARVDISPARLSRLHTHDFPEIFWIEKGHGLHEINGAEKELSCGDLIFIRASDRHCLRAADPAGFTLVNLAFPARLLADLVQRHAEIRALQAGRASLPEQRQISPLQIQHLRDEVRRLASAGRRRMPCERFLLGLYGMASAETEHPATALPSWLERALAAIERPENFAAGVPGFVKRCGRSAEYVARTCRKLLGQSPTELINRARMEHAARELRLGSKPIMDICLECGFENLAHFYALFRAAHGQTPRRYRLSHQQTVF
jgi:AraC family cel operon transcriptional repressor